MMDAVCMGQLDIKCNRRSILMPMLRRLFINGVNGGRGRGVHGSCTWAFVVIQLAGILNTADTAAMVSQITARHSRLLVTVQLLPSTVH